MEQAEKKRDYMAYLALGVLGGVRARRSAALPDDSWIGNGSPIGRQSGPNRATRPKVQEDVLVWTKPVTNIMEEILEQVDIKLEKRKDMDENSPLGLKYYARYKKSGGKAIGGFNKEEVASKIQNQLQWREGTKRGEVLKGGKGRNEVCKKYF